jgi:endogenous inhibitor of DNA gyrase (YacG/DUF329 family)
MAMHCPICGKRFVADLEAPKEQRGEAPFCSDRCRKIDLSHWLDESYRISQPLAPDGYLEVD